MSIRTSKYWKANEYRAWLLYYSIPILSEIHFPPDYLNHFSLLVSSMHINVHSVIHMCDFVHRWGPLWCYSTFGFENLNGFIKKRCHGTRNVLPQLIQAVRMRQSLPTLKKKLSSQENTTTMGFLDKLCRQK